MDKQFLGRTTTSVSRAGPGCHGLAARAVDLGPERGGRDGPTDGGAVYRTQSPSATFNVSGTLTCQTTGPISNVQVYVWIRDQGTGFSGDVTDANGAYSVTLAQGDYDFIFNPPCGSLCASQARKGITGPANLASRCYPAARL